VRDGVADHWAEILGPELRQVNESAEVGKQFQTVKGVVVDRLRQKGN